MDLKRPLTPEQIAALAGVIYPIAAVYLDWPGGVVRAHTGVGSLTFAGATWEGVGGFGQIDVPEDSVGLPMTVATVGLTGLTADIEGRLDDDIRDRAGEIYIGFLSARPGTPGAALIGPPLQVFSGYMDTRRVQVQAADGGKSHAIQISLASGPSARAGASIAHSNEDQRRSHPTDTAGRFLIFARAKAERMTWPQA